GGAGRRQALEAEPAAIGARPGMCELLGGAPERLRGASGDFATAMLFSVAGRKDESRPREGTGMDPRTNVEPPGHVARWLAEYGESRVSAADMLCDRHPPERTALLYEDAASRAERLTFGDLREQSARFAGLLRGL